MFVCYFGSIQLIVYIKVKCSILQTCMFQVLLTESRFLHWYAPVNAQGFVLDVDSTISLGMIELIALILENGSL